MARHSTRTSGPKLGLIIGTAIASLALASCASSAPPAQVSLSKAESALEKGKIGKAVMHAEAAVLAAPREAEYRAVLGSAYLEAGRYNSAATAFGEAIELGDNRGRTVLSYALTKTAIGENRAALRKLQAHQNSLQRADLGLALALAGEADRGVKVLIDSIREGNATPKSRQNLAYAYALAGNWRAARVMASEDVPPAQLDARLSDWAASARPEDHLLRVSNLLGLKAVNDAGQPQHLALANFPAFADTVAQVEQLAKADPAPAKVAAPTTAPAPAPRQSEAMALGFADFDGVTGGSKSPAPAAAPARVAAPAPAPSVAVAQAKPTGPRFVSNTVVQSTPKPAATRAPAPRAAAPKKAPARTAAARTSSASAPKSGAADTHRIQLGSFNTKQVAEAKWAEFQRRYPALRGHDAVLTEAQVNGRTFFRVAAAGFGARDARSVCGSLKASGAGCFAYAKSSPPAGAVNRGVRVAAR